MKVFQLLLLAGAILLIAVGTVAYLGVTALDRGMCGTSVTRRVASPNGRLEAVVFERDCGATTDFGTGVSLVKTGAGIGDQGANLFAADGDHGRAPLDSGNVIRISVHWVGSDSLVLRFDRRARVFQQQPRALGVRVSYISSE